MKTVFIHIAIFCSLVAGAQSAKYNEAMQKQLAMLDSGRTGEQWQQLANTFERIAKAEKTEWHPYYYGAYALIMQAFSEKDISKIDPMLDKADSWLAEASLLKPNNSEIANLQAMALQARMRVDGSRGMTMGPKATEILQKAMAQQPANNPRVYMSLAQNLYYTPEAFGGGKQKGLDLMEKALALYNVFKTESPFDPTWGKPYVEGVLKQWKSGK
jgi:hypothetical protein